MLATILTLVACKQPMHSEIGLATARFISLKFNVMTIYEKNWQIRNF